ncbi:MAG: hypothetical protein II885_08090 [Oscillospiraceae bacterium]|jgi:hypothetical protein|nr:hypothetical protein [Oscillospiraceae bacterium]
MEKYTFFVNDSNTPHLREKTIILGMAYFFSGLNLIACGLLNAADRVIIEDILIGIVFVLMSFISTRDKRQENRGTPAVVLTCILYAALCAGLSVVVSSWWLLVCICEVLLCMAVLAFTRHPQSKKK